MRNLCKHNRLSLKMVIALEVFLKDLIQILGICTSTFENTTGLNKSCSNTRFSFEINS